MRRQFYDSKLIFDHWGSLHNLRKAQVFNILTQDRLFHSMRWVFLCTGCPVGSLSYKLGRWVKWELLDRVGIYGNYRYRLSKHGQDNLVWIGANMPVVNTHSVFMNNFWLDAIQPLIDDETLTIHSTIREIQSAMLDRYGFQDNRPTEYEKPANVGLITVMMPSRRKWSDLMRPQPGILTSFDNTEPHDRYRPDSGNYGGVRL